MKEQIKENIVPVLKSKPAIITAFVIVLYTLTGFFLVPYLVVHFLPGMLTERLQSEVSLEQVKINPYTLTVEAGNFRINEPSGTPIAGFEHLYVNFQLSSLFRWALTFKDVILDDPYLNIVIDNKGNLNLERLAGPEPATPAPVSNEDKEDKRPLRMLLYNIEINKGLIRLTDKRQPVPATASFQPLYIQLADISTIPEREGGYFLTATGGDGTVLQWSGHVTLHPLRSEGELALRHIPLETPWTFFRSMLNTLPPEGELNVETRYMVDLGQDTNIARLNDLNVQILALGLQLKEAKEAFLRLPELTLKAGKIDTIGRSIDELSLTIPGGNLDLISDSDGILNLQRIASRGSAEPPPPEPAGDSGKPWNIDISRFSLKGIALNFRDQSMSPYRVFSTEGISLAFNAAVTTVAPQPQVLVENLDLALQKIAMGFGGAAKPALQVGNLSATKGSFDLATRSASLTRMEANDGIIDVILDRNKTLNLARLFETPKSPAKDSSKEQTPEEGKAWNIFLETLALKDFTTHVTDETVQPGKPLADLANIALTVERFDGKSPCPFKAALKVSQGGVVTVSGTINPAAAAIESTIDIQNLALPVIQPYLAQATDLTLKSGMFSTNGSFSQNGAEKIAYRGKMGIADLEVIENSTNDILLGWTQLRTPDLNLRLNPNGLAMDSLILNGLKGKLIISDDGKVNIAEAFKPEREAPTEPRPKETAPESTEEPFSVKIGRLNLDKGSLHFADFSLKPQFDTRIHELKGVITGISSSPGTRTQVSLDGRVDRYGTNKIAGNINFFNPKEFTDISMIFNNLEMTNLTPYSGKFAGRKIDSGRLSLDLKYHIENSKLLSNNKVVIDSLSLGDRVESPDAVSLPLDLAIALLRDANGTINIGLPVTGSLDDPEFRYGQLVWQTVLNLLTRIVTAPFRALGALLGIGEEEKLNEVLCKPGSGTILPAEEEKLDKLLEAFRQRPQLKLIVTGRYDAAADGQVIRELQARRALAEASGIKLEPGEDPGPVDFSNAKAQKTLAALFVKRYGKPEYKQILAEMTPPPKDKTKEVPKEKISPEEITRKLFAVLTDREKLAPGVLESLADERAGAVVAHMTGPKGLKPERITTKPPEVVGKDETLSVILELDSMEGGS